MTDAGGGHDIAIYKRLGTGDVEPVEWTVFGKGRMGVSRDVASSTTGNITTRRIGTKLYEITDHLGSVRALIPDIKLPSGDTFLVEPVSVYEYDAYGVMRVNRSADLANPYRYGFQGMLRMSEVAPSNTVVNDYSTLFRTYDARTGRWTSHDPILQPWESTYSGLAGNPAMLTDWYGLDADDGGPMVTTMESPQQTTTTTTTTATTETSGSSDGGTEVQPQNPPVNKNKQSNGNETPITEVEGGATTKMSTPTTSHLTQCTPAEGWYDLQPRDNFWDLEERWGLEHGSLAEWNPDFDPNNLKPHDDIITDPDKPVKGPYTVPVTIKYTGPREDYPGDAENWVVTGATAIPLGGRAPSVPLGGTRPVNIAWLAFEVIRELAKALPVTRTKVIDLPVPFWYVTYEKVNYLTGFVYIGRSSGYALDPNQVVAQRDANGHHKDKEGYGSAKLTYALPATKPGFINRANDPSYWAIRGLEQMQIARYKAEGRSGNTYNGVSPRNTNYNKYMDHGNKWLSY